jgi:hypothetical protein
LIIRNEDLEWLGIQRNNCSGMFDQSQVHLIIAFCEANPDYHIVSVTRPGRLANRYILGKRIFFLAHGDDNPRLVLNPFLKKDEHLLAEEMLDEALAMVPDIDRYGQTQ